MKKEEYLRHQMVMIGTVKNLVGLDYDAFVAEIDKAEAIAPMADPTLYRRAMQNMRAVKNLALACKAATLTLKNLQVTAIQTVVSEMARKQKDDASPQN